MSKVTKKVIHNQTSIFLNSRNLLYNYQSGFQKNHSTDLSLIFKNDKILKGFDQGLITGMTLTDFQKVFHTIDHDILLQKLYAIGLYGCMLLHTLSHIYILMICHKLSNVIFFFMLMIHALYVNIKILMKLKNN